MSLTATHGRVETTWSLNTGDLKKKKAGDIYIWSNVNTR